MPAKPQTIVQKPCVAAISFPVYFTLCPHVELCGCYRLSFRCGQWRRLWQQPGQTAFPIANWNYKPGYSPQPGDFVTMVGTNANTIAMYQSGTATQPITVNFYPGAMFSVHLTREFI
jgi:hypothetical protein